MSKDAFRLHLAHRLKRIRLAIAEAEHGHATADDLAIRVKAAGELAVLHRRHAEVAAKLDRLDHAPPGLLAGLKTEIEEDIDSIMLAVERVFVGY